MTALIESTLRSLPPRQWLGLAIVSAGGLTELGALGHLLASA